LVTSFIVETETEITTTVVAEMWSTILTLSTGILTKRGMEPMSRPVLRPVIRVPVPSKFYKPCQIIMLVHYFSLSNLTIPFTTAASSEESSKERIPSSRTTLGIASQDALVKLPRLLVLTKKLGMPRDGVLVRTSTGAICLPTKKMPPPHLAGTRVPGIPNTMIRTGLIFQTMCNKQPRLLDFPNRRGIMTSGLPLAKSTGII